MVGEKGKRGGGMGNARVYYMPCFDLDEAEFSIPFRIMNASHIYNMYDYCDEIS